MEGAFFGQHLPGRTVDEDALYSCAQRKEDRGGGARRFCKRAHRRRQPLLTLPNIILTPHSAALTKECTVRVAMEAAENVIEFVEGRTPKFVFNKEVLA
jgi:D-3-phosphoglycerate dehydrogenase